MSNRRAPAVLSAATFVLTGVALLAAWLLAGSQARIGEELEARSRTLQLADALRQSSDDLTRMARLYAVTGDARYKAYFERMLAIRRGESPRPERYWDVYWDFVADTHEFPQEGEDAQSVALADLIADAGFSAAEIELFRLAEARSDELAEIEAAAMEALPDELAAAAERQHAAVKALHGGDYNRMKAGVMQPIAEMHESLAQRMAGRLESARHGQATWSHVLLVALVLALLVQGGQLIARKARTEKA